MRRAPSKTPGHIALAVVISDAKLPTADQERAVAEAAKVLYEKWAQARSTHEHRTDVPILLVLNSLPLRSFSDHK